MAADLPEALEALEATWPPVEVARFGGLVVGRGAGGGGRLSSIRQAGADWTGADLDAALARQADWGEAPLIRVLDGQERLAAAARGLGMAARQPTAILSAPVADLATGVPPVTAFAFWPPLAIQRGLWAAHGITPARQAAMARVTGPHVALLGRVNDRAAGTGFCAIHGPVAGLHALLVEPALRGAGLGEWMVRRAAIWARDQGARVMMLAVTRENAPALRLYNRMGFRETAGYAYFHAS